jgi:hypothetical protein
MWPPLAVLVWRYQAECLTARVLSDLEAAVRAYAQAQDAVVEAQQRVAEAREQVPIARERLAAAIVAATQAGVRQVDVVRVTGYSREQVRRILRSAGVEAAED